MATSAGGLPYVESTDLVSGYPTVSQDLAETLDTQLAAKADLASPAFTGSPTLNGSPLGGGLTYISQATPSAAASTSINSCFSSTYENYLIVVTMLNSVGAELNVRMRASSTDDTSANYDFQRMIASAATPSSDRTTGATSGRVGYIDTTKTSYAVNVYGPQIAAATMLRSQGAIPLTSAYFQDVVIRHNVATAYDGFTLIPSTGTMTGTIRVYGYQNS